MKYILFRMKNLKQTLWIAVLWVGVTFGANSLISKNDDTNHDWNHTSQLQKNAQPTHLMVNTLSNQITNILHTESESLNVSDELKNDMWSEYEKDKIWLYLINHPDLRRSLYSMYWFNSWIRWNSEYSSDQIHKFLMNTEAITIYLSENPTVADKLIDLSWWVDYTTGVLVPSNENNILQRIEFFILSKEKVWIFHDVLKKNILWSDWFQNIEMRSQARTLWILETVSVRIQKNPEFLKILEHNNMDLD